LEAVSPPKIRNISILPKIGRCPGDHLSIHVVLNLVSTIIRSITQCGITIFDCLFRIRISQKLATSCDFIKLCLFYAEPVIGPARNSVLVRRNVTSIAQTKQPNKKPYKMSEIITSFSSITIIISLNQKNVYSDHFGDANLKKNAQ
jgi:hypothetical protein